MANLLKMNNITKTFGPLKALDDVSISLNKGEILTLLGENGAGKSTLMNILYGFLPFDSGEIELNGEKVRFRSPNDAMSNGVGMVHQHFMLVDVFTAAENIILGTKVSSSGILKKREINRKIKDISMQFGLEIEPDKLVKDLPVGLQQRVEIIKALYKKADILILDEPTAVLTPQEIKELFVIVKRLASEGKSIIFISHKLKEVIEISDKVVVLRAGKKIGEVDNPKETKPAELASMMVGRSINLTVDKKDASPGQTVFEAKNLSLGDSLKNINLKLKKGVIHGVAGVQGNGQTELLDVLTGLSHFDTGKIIVGEETLKNITPRVAHELNIAHIPEDRQKHGLVLDFPLTENFMLNSYYEKPFSNRKIIDHNALERISDEELNKFKVKMTSIFDTAGSLSGGNQQKLIIAREFFRDIKLLIASNPTRGIDVGSIEYIHEKIVERRDSGSAVLLVSTELDEILALSDIISVLYKGEIIATLKREEATREKLGLLMAGVKQ